MDGGYPMTIDILEESKRRGLSLVETIKLLQQEKSAQRVQKQLVDEKESETKVYAYPAKEVWREKWLESMLEHRHRLAEHPKVLALAGYGDDISSYEQVGIPFEDITVVDRDAEKIHHIKNRFPQVNAICADLAEVCELSQERYDIVMLDFNGGFKNNKELVQQVIATKLADVSLVGTNFFAGREHNAQKMDYFDALHEKPLAYLSTLLQEEQNMLAKDDTSSLDQRLDLYALRDQCITSFLQRSFIQSASRIPRDIIHLLPRGVQDEIKLEILQANPRNMEDHLHISDLILSKLSLELQKGESVPHRYLGLLLWLNELDPIYIEQIKRYSYQTKNSGKFYSDFLLVAKDAVSLDSVLESDLFKKKENKPIHIVQSYRQLDEKQQHILNREIARVGSSALSYLKMYFYGSHIPKRISLGGES